MVFHSAQFNVNPKYLSNASISVFNDTAGISRMNFTVKQNVDLIKSSSFITLMGKTNEANREFDLVYMRCTIDSCKLSNGNFLTKAVLDNFEKKSNLSIKCPMNASYYTGSNFNVGYGSVPHFLAGNYKAWEFIIVVKGKVLQGESMVNLADAKVTGAITP